MNRLITISLLIVLIIILLISKTKSNEHFQAPEPIIDLDEPLESALFREVVTYSQGPQGPQGDPGNNATPITLRQILQDFLSGSN